MNTSPRHFCTYFDRRYLLRGVTLLRSLVRHLPGAEFWILCLDEPTRRVLERMSIPNVRLLTPEELEAHEPRLVQARSDRSLVEYYFTSTPCLLHHLLEKIPPGEVLTYLDADLFFYASPEPLYKELGDRSVLIIPHRFPERRRHMEAYGIYNVGLLAFARDERARRCLERWRDQCLEWCHDRLEDGRFGDQKYLDDWPQRCDGVAVLGHKGGGLAPWNVSTDPLSLREGRLHVGSDPLIFFHFHAFKTLRRWVYDSGLGRQDEPMTALLKEHVFRPYIRELKAGERWILSRVPEFRDEEASLRGSLGSYDIRTLIKRLLEGNLLFSFSRFQETAP